MLDPSRIFWFKNVPELPVDDNTIFRPTPTSRPRDFFQELFQEFYPQFRSWLVACRGPGLAAVALDPSGVVGTAYLSAKPDHINTAILGRHSRADMCLEDRTLSLRHLAILVHPHAAGEAIRFRILDLRTPMGFHDEHGRSLRAVEAEGPVFISCGGYILFLMPVADLPKAWPYDPEQAWGEIPERRYLAELPQTPDGDSQEELEEGPKRGVDFARWRSPKSSPTLVRILRGARQLDPARNELPDPDGAIAELYITANGETATAKLNQSGLQSGVLLGRSTRCDGNGVLTDPAISRVHLLIIEVAGKPYAIDTASLNGVWDEHGTARATYLESGQVVTMSDLATVSWRVVN